MSEQRESGAVRRRSTRGGRRQADTTEAGPDTSRLSASVIWHLPDNTRCWMMRHKGRVVVRVSREDCDLRIEVFDSEVEAAAQSDAWCLEYGAAQVG
jgi:hypothetical protein